MKKIAFIFLVYLCLAPASLNAQNFAKPYVISANFFDRGKLAGDPDLAIDVLAGSCGNSQSTQTAEPFSDTLVSVEIKNPSVVPIRISRLSYRLPKANGKLRSWLGGLAPVSSGLIPAKSTATISFFVFKAGTSGKSSFKPNIVLSESLGFQNIVLRLDARSSSGRLIRITETRGLSFGNEDRCTST